MFIERLRVKNLRLLAEQEFSFLRADGSLRLWTAIVGENGVCKSTLLQAIALAALGPKLGSALVKDAQQYRRVPAQGPAEISATFRPAGPGSPVEVDLSIEPGRHDLVEGANRDGAQQIDTIRGFRQPGWFVAGYGAGRYLAKPGEVSAPLDPVVDRVEGLFDVRHKMLGMDFYSVLPNAAQFHERLRAVLLSQDKLGNRLLPGLNDIVFQSRGPLIEMKTGEGSRWLPPGWLSDGYKAMLAWIADLLGHAFLETGKDLDPSELHGIVLLDEIDLHLHPTWQRRVIPVLKHVFSNLQFIVTTHSPLVLAGFEKEEIFQLKLDEDGLVVQDPAGIEPGALTASELLTNFFEVPRAGRPELVRMERRYLELKALRERQLSEENELRQLEQELRPYWSTRPEPEEEILSPQELVTS